MLSKGIVKTGSALSNKRFRILLSIILLVSFLSFAWVILRPPNTRTAVIGNTAYRLEVADTITARQKGLSSRAGLSENEGMLFDFKQPGDWGMWMKDMKFSIDIAWTDEFGRIIKIEPNVSPASFPQIFKAERLSYYVIEVEAGTFNRLNVTVGDKIRLD